VPFAATFENAARKIRTALYVRAPISLRPHRVRTRYKESRPNPSKLRLQVLRRDRYKCRSCDHAGDEITLEVCQIRPCGSTIDEMLTLCVHCRDLAGRWNITASDIRDFLEQFHYRVSSMAAHEPPIGDARWELP